MQVHQHTSEGVTSKRKTLENENCSYVNIKARKGVMTGAGGEFPWGALDACDISSANEIHCTDIEHTVKSCRRSVADTIRHDTTRHEPG